jgi:hypothetical protein
MRHTLFPGAVVVAATLSVTMAGAQNGPITGDDIEVFSEPGSSYIHPVVVALPSEVPSRSGTTGEQVRGPRSGRFGIGATRAGLEVGLDFRTFQLGAFGTPELFLVSAQYEDQQIDIAGVDGAGFSGLEPMFALELEGPDGAADTDAGLMFGPTETETLLPFNDGIGGDPALSFDFGSRTLAMVYQTTDDPFGVDLDGSIAIAGLFVDYNTGPAGAVSLGRVNNHMSGNTLFPDVTYFELSFFSSTDRSGEGAALPLVVVWESFGSPGDDSALSSIQARVLNNDLTGNGNQFQVNTVIAGFQSKPKVAALEGGGFVVVWHSDASLGNDDSGTSIQARIYDTSWQPVGPEFQVNNEIMGFQYDADVAALSGNRFIVVWTDAPISDADIAARIFGGDGTPQGDQFKVNTETPGEQAYPSVAARDDAFMVAWTSGGKIFMNGNWTLFDDGFESGDTTSWSAVLDPAR